MDKGHNGKHMSVVGREYCNYTQFPFLFRGKRKSLRHFNIICSILGEGNESCYFLVLLKDHLNWDEMEMEIEIE